MYEDEARVIEELNFAGFSIMEFRNANLIVVIDNYLSDITEETVRRLEAALGIVTDAGYFVDSIAVGRLYLPDDVDGRIGYFFELREAWA